MVSRSCGVCESIGVMDGFFVYQSNAGPIQRSVRGKMRGERVNDGSFRNLLPIIYTAG